MSDKEWLERGRAVLASQPFSALIGTEMTRLSEHGAELRLAITDQLKQQHGFAHGGVVSYLADNALTFAGGAKLSGMIVTGEMKINYIRPADGDMLIARAEAISAGATQAVVRCDIFALQNGVEKLCAAAQGTINRLPER